MMLLSSQNFLRSFSLMCHFWNLQCYFFFKIQFEHIVDENGKGIGLRQTNKLQPHVRQTIKDQAPTPSRYYLCQDTYKYLRISVINYLATLFKHQNNFSSILKCFQIDLRWTENEKNLAVTVYHKLS